MQPPRLHGMTLTSMERVGPDPLLYFNGINGATGGYGLPPMTGEALAQLLMGQPPAPEPPELRARKQRDDARPEEIERIERELAVLRAALERARVATTPDPQLIEALAGQVQGLERALTERQHLGVVEGIDPTDLAQAGWGVIFAADADPAIREALGELLEWRAAQAGARFRCYDGRERGYRPNEPKAKFLVRQGADPSGPADPDKVPYYLLIVASPAQISYAFQYQLDVQYAVGRIWFPELEQYAHYARSVVAAETGGIRRPRRLSFFGVKNEDDAATELGARLLVQPLHEQLAKNTRGWDVQTVAGGEATRKRLTALLGSGETPALLFTASHGMDFPLGDARQLPHQGALLCSDWPGPRAWKGQGEVPERFYLAGDHLTAEADVAGMMLFCFACFGAGTPQHDEFGRLKGGSPKAIAASPFVSALPMALLGRPAGALAVVGHVDRAWACSFTGGGARAKSHTTTFGSALERLIGGQPVGHALDYFNARYAELATELAEELQDEFKQHDPYALAALWTANNDARGYVVFGDPAARLRLEGGATQPSAATTSVSSGGPRATAATTVAAAAGESVIVRPAAISEADWDRTPLAVRRYIDELRIASSTATP
jgi:hypothetical protein